MSSIILFALNEGIELLADRDLDRLRELVTARIGEVPVAADALSQLTNLQDSQLDILIDSTQLFIESLHREICQHLLDVSWDDLNVERIKDAFVDFNDEGDPMCSAEGSWKISMLIEKWQETCDVYC